MESSTKGHDKALRPRWLGKKVAVVGLGISNVPLIQHLIKAGAEVTVSDRQKPGALQERLAEIADLPVSLNLGEGYLDGLDGYDTVFLSPGVPKDLPQIQTLLKRGVSLSSEIQVFFELCKAPIMGVTGSSGKTTTTSLIGEIMKQIDKFHTFVGGNIGTSLLPQLDSITQKDLAVLELSSFQLELLPYSPHCAVITNISPNHLDIHKTMENYIDAKRHIYLFQDPEDFAVLNHDEPQTKALADECPGQVYFFSRVQELAQGVFVKDGLITVKNMCFAEGGEKAICPIEAVRLLGDHNLENVLAATAAAALCGATPEAIRQAITTFTGVPHRLEFVEEIGGVRYYNDSIATSPARAIAGIKAFQEPLVLIAGGYDKQLSFDLLAKVIMENSVRAVVLTGDTKEQIEKALKDKQEHRGELKIYKTDDFDGAVLKAGQVSEPGDVVLMSPACASYDMFSNFQERGVRFRQIVKKIKQSKFK